MSLAFVSLITELKYPTGHLKSNRNHFLPVPIAQVVEPPLWEREDVGSIPGRAIRKSLKIVPVATLLGAQHYKASTGSPLTYY